ncbi:type II secretion system GspH family protein [bacterium]|nr:type II secretion system GspH family protein [bacterium]MBU1025428.1 type II secretion system GspH family protein [bacterium]
MRCTKNINNADSGFTLLEILLVVSIIAILVTMAIPQITGTRNSSYEVSAMRALSAVGAAQHAYHNAYGTFVSWDSLQDRNYISPNFLKGGLSDRGRIAKHYSVRVFIDGPISTPRGVRFTGFSVLAVPDAGFGLRYFRMQEDGTIEQSTSGAGGWETR